MASGLRQDIGAVEYVRGPDLGGGVGGMLYTLRPEGGTLAAKYSYANGRGDVVAQANQGGTVTWTASYEAFGTRKLETGTNADRQRANTKEEDPTGLLNEGFRYRDLETGTWLSRDPAGFVDGPNLYAYVQQNPWTKFDPDGLFWSAIITAGFAAYDTYQYATGQTSGADYAQAMALNGAALVADIATAGQGGGLAVRAANASIKVAKAVDRASNAYDAGVAMVENGGDLASAIGDGDGRRVLRAAATLAVDAGGGKKNKAQAGNGNQRANKDSAPNNLSPTNYPNPDPNMSAPAVRYDPKTNEELMRMRSGQGPTTKATHGDQNIEPHHRQQLPISQGGVIDEITKQQHRGVGQHSRHSKPSQLTKPQRASEIREHYKERSKEYVTGGEGI